MNNNYKSEEELRQEFERFSSQDLEKMAAQMLRHGQRSGIVPSVTTDFILEIIKPILDKRAQAGE